MIVPSGLYYAVGSITLRHPEAQLILQPGVQILFAEYASIRVDYGVLKVLGSMDEPVHLAPTMNFTRMYGSMEIPNSTVFGGIYFGPNSNGTLVGDGNQYISGSILQGLYVNFGGYHQASASVYLNRVSVMLRKVSIMGDWSKSVYGVYIYDPEDLLLLDEVSVESMGSDGIYIGYASNKITLTNLEVLGCRYYGIRIVYSSSSSMSRSHIHHNGQYGNAQVYIYDWGKNASNYDHAIHADYLCDKLIFYCPDVCHFY